MENIDAMYIFLTTVPAFIHISKKSYFSTKPTIRGTLLFGFVLFTRTFNNVNDFVAQFSSEQITQIDMRFNYLLRCEDVPDFVRRLFIVSSKLHRNISRISRQYPRILPRIPRWRREPSTAIVGPSRSCELRFIFTSRSNHRYCVKINTVSLENGRVLWRRPSKMPRLLHL